MHPKIEGKDWHPIKNGTTLFKFNNKDYVVFEREDDLIPVFINEAAYREKNIAMSLTQREVLAFDVTWAYALKALVEY